MTGIPYTDMAWLPRPPRDVAAQCRALLNSSGSIGDALQRLAQHALDENQLNQLARTIARARQSERSLAPLIPFRLGIISNATSHHIVPAMVATAARHGFALDCIEGDFGQVMQEALSPDSSINRARPDAVLVALDFRGLPVHATPGDMQAAQQTVTAALDHIGAIRAGFHQNSGAPCILQTVPRPVEPHFGSFDMMLPGTPRALADAVNRGLAESLAGTEDLLLDVAGVAETVGLEHWHDPKLWNLAKFPFSTTFLPLYAEHACRLVAAMRGKSRRCLVLDLDNTLWGGVIGDDGLEGIVLAQGDPTGEAHLEVQRAALILRNRGVVLAVSSKNTDETARLPFRDHDEMLLREDHIAVFQANWEDKATNIKAIAEELSLGLDAIAFLDDNPVERNLVRSLLPQVAVLELPDDPALYARTLLASGYFEAVALSDEDRRRAQMYQDNARRVALQKGAGDIDGYLASLRMVMSVQPFDKVGRARISQLLNKSNQYNLTTRRYSEAEVASIEADPDCFAMQVRLADALGDNGMISVIICRRAGDDWEIDSWLMSCRVLGRKVESTLLAELVAQAKKRNVQRLFGLYLPTPRNGMVADHYRKLGFSFVEQREDGSALWRLDVADATGGDTPIEIRRSGLE